MAGGLWQRVWGVLRTRRESTPIDSVVRLEEFVVSRSAYIAQKTLYNYVKARMGTRYPQLFEDDTLIESLDIAKRNVFAGCLSDLTVFAVGTALAGAGVDDDSRIALARRVYEAGLQSEIGENPEQFSIADSIGAFERRLAMTDWRQGALHADNFTQSPRDLYRWAPIADKLKRLDAEIVENSIKFAWRDIREQYRTRVDPAAIGAEWTSRAAVRAD